MLEEFKKFAVKGNVIDLAVGVVIGGAFGKIVTSFVNDVLMPTLGVIIGGVNFKNLKLTLVQAVGETPAVTLNYGSFLQAIIDFLIISFSIFLFVKILSSTKKKAEETPAPVVVNKQEQLLEEIRDLLKNSHEC